jgi:hypothetical protein
LVNDWPFPSRHFLACIGFDDDACSIRDHGVSNQESHCWRRLAAVPEQLSSMHSPRPAGPRARRSSTPWMLQGAPGGRSGIWRMLRGLGRLRHLDPREIDAGFLPKMREQVRELAPAVIAWLARLAEPPAAKPTPQRARGRAVIALQGAG